MYIRGLLNFVKKHEDTSICNSIIAKIAEFWVHSDHKSKAEKFRSAFDFFSCANLQLKKEGALKAASVQVKERAAEKIRQVSDIFQSKPEWSAKLPPANQNILKIAQELHTSGQLHPWIFVRSVSCPFLTSDLLAFIVKRRSLLYRCARGYCPKEVPRALVGSDKASEANPLRDSLLNIFFNTEGISKEEEFKSNPSSVSLIFLSFS